jgi:hypothetical protein
MMVVEDSGSSSECSTCSGSGSGSGSGSEELEEETTHSTPFSPKPVLVNMYQELYS